MSVTCKPLGQLGNQLHVLASCLGIAHRMGQAPALPAWPYRPFFSIPDEFFADDPSARSAHDLSGLPASQRDYLQNRSLWADIEADIRSWFSPSELVADLIGDPRDNIGLHVRRGDYHTLGPELYLPLWDTDYYRDALGLLPEAGTVEVYTDDPLWMRAISPEWVVHDRDEDWRDLFRLSRHRYIVTANSTFSYWAGVIGDPEVVTIPSRWYGPQIADQGWTPDSFTPPQWVRVDV